MLVAGVIQSWNNPETGASGEVKVVKESTKTERTTVQVLKGTVEQMPPLEGEITNYTVIRKSEIYGGPGTDYKVVGKQVEGNILKAQKVKGADWYAIIQGDVTTTGFMVASSLEKNPTATVTNTEPPIGETEPRQIDRERACKTLEQYVTQDDGEVVSEQIEYCQEPNGQWAIVS